ncbi:MAG: ribonuclease III [Magnetococcales bacterium]|nr:ribonuclease III [Magnetococcales bacterium]
MQWSCQHLEYIFSDITLLRQALTHRSVAQDEPDEASEVMEVQPHNERLEFLGDAVLDLAVSVLLYHRFPQASEGEMSHWRSTFVSTNALSHLGRELELGSRLRLGRGEAMSGGRDKASILGNSLEAILGAVFLDGGWTGIMTVMERLFRDRLDQFAANGGSKDFKTVLQERLQGVGRPLPCYTLDAVSGDPHERRFSVGCRVNETITGRGNGNTKRRAEQEAAREALLFMDQQEGRLE